MQNARYKKTKRTDPHAPLVFQTATLGPASARSEERVVPAPADLGSGMVRVPEGGEISLRVLLEEVSEGVLVTASAAAPLIGECSRCLDEFRSSTEVTFSELFVASADDAGEDGYLLDGDLLDLEPALRDALVLELPLSPLCSADCAGLCGICGVRLADADPGHWHEPDAGVWLALKDFFPAGHDRPGAEAGDTRSAGDESGNGSSRAGTTDPGGTKER